MKVWQVASLRVHISNRGKCLKKGFKLSTWVESLIYLHNNDTWYMLWMRSMFVSNTSWQTTLLICYNFLNGPTNININLHFLLNLMICLLKATLTIPYRLLQTQDLISFGLRNFSNSLELVSSFHLMIWHH